MAGKKGMTIKKSHEDSERFKEYWKKQNPNWTDQQCEEKAKWFRKSCNYLCLEYYEKNYPNLTHEEHIQLKNNAIIKQHQNKDTNIEYWKLKYPKKSLEELEELRSKSAKEKNKCNLEYWIKKYPNKSLEEVKELHNKHYQSWLSHQEGWGKGQKNHNHKSNSTQYERNSKSPKCIEFYERNYPKLSHEDHLKLLKEHNNKTQTIIKNNNRYNTTLEFYLNKGMSEEEAKLALKERQRTFSLKKCIEKYGEIEGVIRFSERQQKWLKSLYNNFQSNGDGRSKQSIFAKEIIKYCCKQLEISVPKYEKYIYDKTHNCAYAYDFIFKNRIIEFQGDYWHCNPKLFDSSFYNKVKEKTAKEIWEYDEQKKKCAEKYNYKVLYIWEYDYNENKEETLKKCIEFLNS